MKIFRIRWELILAILLLIASLVSWLSFAFIDTSLNTLAVATMTTFALLYIVVGFDTIAKFRHEVINHWN